MSKGLTRAGGALAKAAAPLSPDWLPSQPKLPREVFREGLRLIRPSLTKPLTRDAAAAFWIVAAEFREDDFRAAVKVVLAERFITPAVLRKCLEGAREDRIQAERRERQRREAEEWRVQRHQARREDEQHRAELETERASWAAPPADAAELLRRMAVVLELDQRRPSLCGAIREARAAGPVTRPTVTTAEGLSELARLHRAEYEMLASALAGAPVAIAFEERPLVHEPERVQ